ncbi:unnamed protein product [Phytophthora fragariaefolia]|uniref:Unnamed protein product n=1 Tax=Phytophthora fragariaefolia TaxID=1490495 RepID=A0A9W6YDR5_9STRA|nr:unnamed protein product [Phytophthora fragariaefolia]
MCRHDPGHQIHAICILAGSRKLSMRSQSSLVLALVLVLAFSSAVLADWSRAVKPLNNNYGRQLRAVAVEADDMSDDDDERLLGYNTLQLWRMRRAANKIMNSNLTTQQEAALTKWLSSKQDKFLAKWLQSSSVYPDQVYSKLGLSKLGARAKDSPNYILYEKYTDELLQRWKNVEVRPETVYKSLRLDKLGAKAKDSPSFPIYEKFLKLTQSEGRVAPSQQDAVVKKWLESTSLYPDKVYKDLGLANWGARAKDSPDYILYEKYTDALFERWANFKPSPETVYKSLRLDDLGAKAKDSPSYPIYEKYLKTYFPNQPAN